MDTGCSIWLSSRSGVFAHSWRNGPCVWETPHSGTPDRESVTASCWQDCTSLVNVAEIFTLFLSLKEEIIWHFCTSNSCKVNRFIFEEEGKLSILEKMQSSKPSKLHSSFLLCSSAELDQGAKEFCQDTASYIFLCACNHGNWAKRDLSLLALASRLH